VAVQRLQFLLSESRWEPEQVNARRLELLRADPATGQVLPEPAPLRHTGEKIIEPGRIPPPAGPEQADTVPAWSSLITGFELTGKPTVTLPPAALTQQTTANGSPLRPGALYSFSALSPVQTLCLGRRSASP
jgi:hypothetical protein